MWRDEVLKRANGRRLLRMALTAGVKRALRRAASVEIHGRSGEAKGKRRARGAFIGGGGDVAGGPPIAAA